MTESDQTKAFGYFDVKGILTVVSVGDLRQQLRRRTGAGNHDGHGLNEKPVA